MIPSDDTFKLKEDSTPTTHEQNVHNQKFDVGMVKEQVGVAFTYPNLYLSGMVFGVLRPCCLDKRGSTVSSFATA